MHNSNSVALGSRRVGDGRPVFIVFEAGPTHDGLEAAKELCDCAARAGGDAVKFQILDPDRLVSDRKQLFTYDILLDKETGETRTVSEPLYEILRRRCLSRADWVELKTHCDSLGLLFFSTATFKDEVDFLVSLGCETIKICSGDIDHLPLIEYVAKSGVCVQLDSGNATIGDIERAVDVIQEAGNGDVIIHNCPSGYPAKVESINLRMIKTLKEMFRCPVAFSDHSVGWQMDIAAVALGANMIEKTITLDRYTPSVEHMFSLEPPEMIKFVESMRELEIALGGYRRIMTTEERRRARAVRRSIVLARDVSSGEIAADDTVEFARPGSGIPPPLASFIIGKRFRRHLKRGTILSFEDVEVGTSKDKE